MATLTDSEKYAFRHGNTPFVGSLGEKIKEVKREKERIAALRVMRPWIDKHRTRVCVPDTPQAVKDLCR